MNAVYSRQECRSQQTAWQVTRSSDIKNTCTILHHAYAFQRNRLRFTFTKNTAVARRNAKTLVLLQWPWQEAMSAAGGEHYCSATVLFAVSSQSFHRLLTNGQPCGWTTSVPAIHKQVIWQDTRRSDVKSRPKFLRRIFPHHTNCLYLDTAVVSVKDVVWLCIIPVVQPQEIVPSCWRGEPSHSACRPATFVSL